MSLLACVEVGGSGCQTVVFDGDRWHLVDDADCPPGAELALAVPGLIDAGRVVAASNLGWYDVDPADQLGLPGPATVVLNDAEAAALGEAARRGGEGPLPDLVFIGLGTGIGGAVVEHGEVVADNLFGHARTFSDLPCRCGEVGCLETVVSGWALPERLDGEQIRRAAEAIARAIEDEPFATPDLVVVAGGMAATNSGLVETLRRLLPRRTIEPTAAPRGAKSASAWGLRHAVGRAAARH